MNLTLDAFNQLARYTKEVSYLLCWRKLFNINHILGGSPGLVVMGGNPMVVSSIPSTVYWMDIFPHLFVINIVLCVWKDKNKWKRGRVGPFKKIIDHTSLINVKYNYFLPMYGSKGVHIYIPVVKHKHRCDNFFNIWPFTTIQISQIQNWPK